MDILGIGNALLDIFSFSDEDIDNIAGKGRVEVNGISWTARSSDGANFRKGELVTVERIEGVKLIVKAQN